MANLRKLVLTNNQISDAGMIALSDAIGTGPLGSLVYLSLRDNRIGDEGMKAFLSAIAPSGPLANCQFINLNNKYSITPSSTYAVPTTAKLGVWTVIFTAFLANCERKKLIRFTVLDKAVLGCARARLTRPSDVDQART